MQDFSNAFDVRAALELADVRRELVAGGPARDDAGDHRVVLAAAHLDDPLGFGRLLVDGLLDEARLDGLTRVFVLTRAPGLFERLRFSPMPRESLPQKVFVDCSICARRERCDELALVKEMS